MFDYLRSKNFDRWIVGYAKSFARSLVDTRPRGPKHLLFAVCDHFEPLWGAPPIDKARDRVQKWVELYPRLASSFRDADGRAPQHTFFFPGEEYQPEFFDGLDRLVRAGFGEIELHLHHDHDTESNLRADIQSYLATYAARGHLSRSPTGEIRYGFIHGNWALANARPDGQNCGVDAELPLLFDTGCYADFTFPSVPDVSQPSIVNQIYWPTGELHRRRSYESGKRARVGEQFDDRILMIQGPLGFWLRNGTLVPRIEYGALTGGDPPTLSRVRSWVAQNIHVENRSDWVFVKVYTHGTQEPTMDTLLGAGGRALHEALTGHYNDGIDWILHYVTAREMYNIAKAAMAGQSGDPGQYRDFELAPPPIRSTGRSESEHPA